MSDEAVNALRARRKADSEAKRQAVLEALAEAKQSGRPIDKSKIAGRAGVSRQFIYSHPDLRARVEDAERNHRPASRRREISTEVEQGLRADRSTLAAKIKKQRTTIAELRERVADLEVQRQRWLGEQLVGRDAVDPEVHTELRLTVDRLMSDKDTLSRTVNEVRRINGILEAELAASREAHAADVARSLSGAGAGAGGSVTPLPTQ